MSEARAERLPPGWALTTLGQSMSWGSGGTPLRSRAEYYNGDIPWAIIGDLSDGPISRTASSITELGLRSSAAKWVQPGSVLLAMYGSIGKLGINTIPLTTNQAIAFTAPKALDAKYLFFFLMSARPELISKGKGGTQSNISQTVIKAFRFVVAPRAEQHRIVEAIESYFTRLDDALVTLERVQRRLKRYRASVLKAAVEGRLVPTEAELARAEGRSYEPASVLLERILAERRRRWEETELAKMTAKRKVPKDDKWKAKYEEPTAPDTSGLPPLPDGWCWGTLGQVFEILDSQRIPVNSAERSQRTGDVPYYGATGQVGWIDDYLFDEELILLGEDGAPFLDWDKPKAYVIHGKSWVNNHAHVLRALSSTPPTFWRQSLDVVDYHDFVSGTTRLKLSQGPMKQIPLPIPPLAEQQRIAAETERHLSVISVVETELKHDDQRMSKLHQSILKWAFEGRLVDQDPTDEPASTLLERIRAERQSAGDTAPKARGRRKARAQQS